VRAYQADYPVSVMCRVFGVTTSGFDAWSRRAPSKHRLSDLVIGDRIETFFRASRSTYGRPRIHADLRDTGIAASGKRVARLMRERRIYGASRRKWTTTTVRNPHARPAPDLVDRRFVADRPDQLWVADITYVPTWAGFLYVAIVLDAFSRRVVGWAMANHLRTELVLDALNMAIYRRNPVGVVHHSDQGTQYTSIAFGQRCREAGIRPSMGSVGDCYDNAMCESFNATLECELLVRRSFPTHRDAEIAVFEFIEGWYNPHRRHSSIGYVSPNAFEQQMSSAA
jgi:putative transposase